jgi:hypothetical protein
MTQRTSIMGLKKMKSRFFGTGSSSSTSITVSASSSSRGGGPPPIPAISNISAAGTQYTQQPSQRETQKSQKLPTRVTYVTNEMIRELRELVRYRYALDCKIWDIGRKARWYQRDTVITDMGRSDAALLAIKDTLSAWDHREYFERRSSTTDSGRSRTGSSALKLEPGRQTLRGRLRCRRITMEYMRRTGNQSIIFSACRCPDHIQKGV